MKKIVCVLALAVTLFSCSPKQAQEVVSNYPLAQKGDVVDTLFGTPVPDPYRWMENDTAKETGAWVAAENEVTFGYLSKIPFRDAVRKRLDEIVNYERLSTPHREGDYYYYTKNSGLQNLNVHYRKKGENGAEEVFLDPNTFTKDGTTNIAGMAFTRDGSLIAMSIQEGGSDWRKIVVLKAETKEIVGDTIRDLKFGGASWQGNDGFYYGRFDSPKGNKLFATVNFNKYYYHKLGTPQKDDKLIFDGNQTPPRRAFAYLTEDERYLVMGSVIAGAHGNDLMMKDLKDPKGKLIPIVTTFEQDYFIIDNDGPRMIVQTDAGAPNGKIMTFDFSKPDMKNWKDLIPESTLAVQGVSTGGKKIFINYLKDASTLVKQFDNWGKEEREVKLPGIGSANGFGGRMEEKEIYYTFTSFTTPSSIYKYDIASGNSTLYTQPKVGFDPADYEVKQIFFPTKDGKDQIPMFIVHKKGLELNGKNPTWLYAYGGFSISETPNFSATRVVWLENGGVFAMPNIRGGGEYGERWHDAGRLMNKQNVFDDFIGAAEYLFKEKYTSSSYLAIVGGSNGGLLVGATMTQRPDLAKVALPAVGVMDMLRYHKFTVGAAWAYDYGKAEDSKEMFEYLMKYSPLHALKPNTAYPATLVTTADHDDRVLPAHSFKFTATLQADNTGPNPTLIRIDTKSGHGASNLSKGLDVTADLYAFTWYNMGIIPPMVKKNM